jgi:hypothetical protein
VCGLLALCGLVIRLGSPCFGRFRGRATARMWWADSRRTVSCCSRRPSILGNRWCARNCTRVVCNGRRIGSWFPLVVGGSGRASPLRAPPSPLLWSVLGITPLPSGGVGLVAAGAISSVIPVKRRPRTNIAGRGIPRHPQNHGGVFRSWQAKHVRSCGCILKPQSAQLIGVIISPLPQCIPRT